MKPSGTVTFLFTDLRDSTPLWERDAAAMRSVMERHDQLVATCVEAHRGTVVKSTGDGFMVVFGDATDAVAAAIDIQRAISGVAWTVPVAVRIGVNTGTAHESDGDYHAPAVNRAARIANAAHPGQILVSAATAAVADGFTFRDLGEHRLKGLPVIALHQVVADGIADGFPALDSATSAAVQLPSPATQFVGRDDEIQRVVELVRGNRVVTLIGVGGSGKTRLAIEAATRAASAFADGVRFVDLASVTADAAVPDAICSALGLEGTTDEPLDRLRNYVTRRELLIVLDNCEHVLDAGASFAELVCESHGKTRVLATSREALAIDGEQLYSVRSLAIDTDAVALFVDRARRVRDAFEFDIEARVTVAEICTRLDGIPLAIELAAAQVGHLSVVQVLELLNERFSLLVGSRRSIQRQQTLAATLDWSHETLTAEEQASFRRLAVFPAGFPLEAAQAVLGEPNAVRDVATLVAKSLLELSDDGERFRYHMLETVRMYAEARLVEAGEAAEYRLRHREWVLAWLASMPLEERWFGDDSVAEREYTNLRAALELSQALGDAQAVAFIASGVDWSRGPGRRDGVHWLKSMRSADLPSGLRAQVLTALGALMISSLDRDALEAIGVAVAATANGPDSLHAVARAWFATASAVAALQRKDDAVMQQAREDAELALTTSRRCSAPWQMYCDFVAGMTWASFGTVHPEDRVRAEAHYRYAAETAPTGAPFRGLRATLYEYHALFALLGGDIAGALVLSEEAPLGSGQWPMFSPHRSAARALALASAGAVDAAYAALRDIYDAYRRADLAQGFHSVCMYGGAIAAILGEWQRAARLLEAGRAGMYAGAEGGIVYFHYRDVVRAALSADEVRRCRDEGRALSLDDALVLALR